MKKILLMCVILLCVAGCNSLGLRYEPTEPQKQSAWLTADLAKEVESEGTVPGSPAAKRLVEGTKATAYYYGPPKVPADMSQFDTIASMAQRQAQERPDPWALADSALELAIGVSALLGGVYGTKAVKYLSTARQKAKALEQVVVNNELFKSALSPPQRAKFGDAQQRQSQATRALVAEIKVKSGTVIKPASITFSESLMPKKEIPASPQT